MYFKHKKYMWAVGLLISSINLVQAADEKQPNFSKEAVEKFSQARKQKFMYDRIMEPLQNVSSQTEKDYLIYLAHLAKKYIPQETKKQYNISSLLDEITNPTTVLTDSAFADSDKNQYYIKNLIDLPTMMPYTTPTPMIERKYLMDLLGKLRRATTEKFKENEQVKEFFQMLNTPPTLGNDPLARSRQTQLYIKTLIELQDKPGYPNG